MKLINGVTKKIERFETHHRILVFLLALIGTIFLTRIFVSIHNPNPIILNFELHHFDYGILLLLVSSKLLLFGPKNHNLIYMFLTAVASGLVIDDYLFIRKSVVEYPIQQTQIYNSTFPYVLILIVLTVLVTLFIQSFTKNRGK